MHELLMPPPRIHGEVDLLAAERLTRQVADCLSDRLNPRGAGVVLEAEHSCMTLRGVRPVGSVTVTSALLGSLSTDPRARSEFLALTGVHD